MTWRGAFSGALLLIALEAVLRSNQSADRFGGLITGLAEIAERVISPAVPAIPDLRDADAQAS